VVREVDGFTIDRFVHETISNKVSLICTDAYKVDDQLDGKYPHGAVDFFS
jgi:hypothetical protein